jgi:hypothetical protein
MRHAPQDAGHGHAAGQVEEDDPPGACKPVGDHGAVMRVGIIAVDYPARLDSEGDHVGDEVLMRSRDPAGVVEQRIGMMNGQAQPLAQLPGERRLAAARRPHPHDAGDGAGGHQI